MIAVSCKEELITERYEDLRSKMAPDAHFVIFEIGSWMEPWGFGREDREFATKVYNEALEAFGWDTVLSISEDEYAGYIIIALRSQNEIGIVYIAEDNSSLNEYVEDLLNYISVRKVSTVSVPKIPEPKKPDNLVINKLNLFK